MTPRGQGVLCQDVAIKSFSENALFFLKYILLYFEGWFKQTQKDSFEGVPFDSYCINRLYCSFPLALLIFIYSMIGLLICKYEPFWQEVSVVSDTQVTVKATCSTPEAIQDDTKYPLVKGIQIFSQMKEHSIFKKEI